MSAEFKDQFVTVNGLKLHYVEWGSVGTEKTPMILLHGVTGNARHWDHIGRAFQDTHRVLALDMRGYGDSDWSPEEAYESTDMAADLAALFNELGLREAVIIGASWGGLVGLLHAAGHPETVSKLVIVDIGCEFGQTETEIPPRPLEFEDAQALENFERTSNIFPALWTLRPYLENSVKEVDGKLVRKHDPVFVKRWPFRNMTYWEHAQQVQCPTLLLRGARSYVLSPELAAKTAEGIPDCRLEEIRDAGHLIAIDNPPAFEAAVRRFLAG